MTRGIGIDGCRSGWAIVVIDTTMTQIQFSTFPSITELWRSLKPRHNQDLLFIDIPIGLPEGPSGINNTVTSRNSDQDSRNLLARSRKSSVFNTPTRQAVYSEMPSMTNYAIVNKKLSKQSEGIIPKIREVDGFIEANLKDNVSQILLESHPELCFQRFNNNQGLLNKKKSQAGILERSHILIQSGFSSDQLTNLLNGYKNNFVTKDDILDASVLALSAYRIISGISVKQKVTSLIQLDYSQSIEMNIYYC